VGWWAEGISEEDGVEAYCAGAYANAAAGPGMHAWH